MISQKKYKYVYEDTVIITEIEGEKIGMEKGKMFKMKTAKNHPNVNAPIQYCKDGKTCYIYSDIPISGLKLIAQNKISHSCIDITSISIGEV
jgi:hypothetical protein